MIVCAPMRSNINLSRIARAAGCCGIERIDLHAGRPSSIGRLPATGRMRWRSKSHRTLGPVLDKLRDEGYRLVGLEQTTNSQNLHQFQFARRTALVIGNERTGLTEDLLAKLDDVVEIPVWGLPYSYNVATATTMALYEYCRQFPNG